MSTFKIYPLYLGYSHYYWTEALAKSHPEDNNYDITLGSLLLQNNQTGEWTILDTGIPSKEEMSDPKFPYHYQDDPNGPDSLEAALKDQFNLTPADFKQAGISHLHSDHCWNLDKFRPDMPVYIQQKELENAVRPMKPERGSYQYFDYPGLPAWTKGLLKYKPIDGTYEIEPGLTAVLTPGHTYGSQSFLIDTDEGQYIYVGDLYYCQENIDRDQATGWRCDTRMWYESHEFIKRSGAKPLSIHLSSIFDQKCYG